MIFSQHEIDRIAQHTFMRSLTVATRRFWIVTRILSCQFFGCIGKLTGYSSMLIRHSDLSPLNDRRSALCLKISVKELSLRNFLPKNKFLSPSHINSMEHQRHHLDRSAGEIETGFAEVAAPHSTRARAARTILLPSSSFDSKSDVLHGLWSSSQKQLVCK